ncbi:MAG TPA: hypothetical protein VMV17_09705 [Streptosporangiaceae bacterium]|nr:hypothetical protein [Streptosporangiaceae bacterium]
MISSILFLVTGTAIGVAVVIAIFATIEVYYLSGSRALADDGLPRGSAAPAWSLTDTAGSPAASPPQAGPLQLIVFADHSLKSFPSVADGLRELAERAPGLEIVMLTRQPGDLARAVLDMNELGRVPVVTGSPALYGKYNVRVMPFLVFVDSAGRVRACSLVNHAWQVAKLWRLAQIDPSEDTLATVPARTGARA